VAKYFKPQQVVELLYLTHTSLQKKENGDEKLKITLLHCSCISNVMKCNKTQVLHGLAICQLSAGMHISAAW